MSYNNLFTINIFVLILTLTVIFHEKISTYYVSITCQLKYLFNYVIILCYKYNIKLYSSVGTYTVLNALYVFNILYLYFIHDK